MRAAKKYFTWDNIKVSTNGQFTFPKDARLALDPNHISEGDRQSFIISRLTSAGCLVCLSVAEFEDIIDMLNEAGEDDELRRIGRASFEIETDEQGRVVIPATLRRIFPLGGSITVSAMGSRYELWPSEASDQYYEEEYTTEKLQNQTETIKRLKKERAART